MKIYITTFNNVQHFTSNIIPISTAGSYGWPFWLYQSDKQKRGTYYLNKNNVMIGIVEESLVFPGESFDILTEQCQKNCPYQNKAPHCQFMDAYYKYLKTLDFNHLLFEFERIAEDVRKINHFEGEPTIVLLVYESPERVCGERYGLRKLFNDHGYSLDEWTKDAGTEDIF